MCDSAVATRTNRNLPGTGFCKPDKILRILHGLARIHEQECRCASYESYRGEVLDGIIWNFVEHGWIKGVWCIGQEQRVTVARGVGDHARGDSSACTGLVFHDHRLSENRSKSFTEHPSQYIARSSGPIWSDQVNRFGRIRLFGLRSRILRKRKRSGSNKA